jgi:hypothetical protein
MNEMIVKLSIVGGSEFEACPYLESLVQEGKTIIGGTLVGYSLKLEKIAEVVDPIEKQAEQYEGIQIEKSKEPVVTDNTLVLDEEKAEELVDPTPEEENTSHEPGAPEMVQTDVSLDRSA